MGADATIRRQCKPMSRITNRHHQHRFEGVGSNFEFVIFRCTECGREFEDPCEPFDKECGRMTTLFVKFFEAKSGKPEEVEGSFDQKNPQDPSLFQTHDNYPFLQERITA